MRKIIIPHTSLLLQVHLQPLSLGELLTGNQTDKKQRIKGNKHDNNGLNNKGYIDEKIPYLSCKFTTFPDMPLKLCCFL